MKVLFINFKKNIIPIMFLLFTICLIIFSKSNIQAVKNSLNIWVNNVIPSLFPFFIAEAQRNDDTENDKRHRIDRKRLA